MAWGQRWSDSTSQIGWASEVASRVEAGTLKYEEIHVGNNLRQKAEDGMFVKRIRRITTRGYRLSRGLDAKLAGVSPNIYML